MDMCAIETETENPDIDPLDSYVGLNEKVEKLLNCSEYENYFKKNIKSFVITYEENCVLEGRVVGGFCDSNNLNICISTHGNKINGKSLVYTTCQITKTLVHELKHAEDYGTEMFLEEETKYEEGRKFHKKYIDNECHIKIENN